MTSAPAAPTPPPRPSPLWLAAARPTSDPRPSAVSRRAGDPASSGPRSAALVGAFLVFEGRLGVLLPEGAAPLDLASPRLRCKVCSFTRSMCMLDGSWFDIDLRLEVGLRANLAV